MPYFMVDDNLPANRKVRSLVESALDGDLAGVAAGFLWTLGGADCNRVGTDGVVKRVDLIRLLLNPQLVDRLAALLVDVGLWHAPGHSCRRCPPVTQGTFLYHDWFELGYDTAEQTRTNRAKRKELKDSEVIARVWARDCVDPSTPTIGRCRYCAVELKRADKRSDKRWQLDHVDPNAAYGVRNLVLACNTCNQKKGNRTPGVAGLTLLPPPRPEPIEDSPSRTAAGTGSPEKSAAGTGSPDVNDAETSMTGSPRTRSQTAQGDHLHDHSDRSLIEPPDNHLIAAVPARVTRVSAGQAGSGQGIGLGRGVGKGDAGLPADTTTDPEIPRKRGRRRGKKRSRTSNPDQSPATAATLDAGNAPAVQVPGRFGSPYFGWTGPPSTVDETTCPDHSLPEPCWKCAARHGDVPVPLPGGHDDQR